MGIFVHIPSSPLNAYIQCMWYCDDPAPYHRMKMLPTPSLHLMFNFGDSYQIYEANPTLPFATCAESWTVGLWNTFHIMDWPLHMQILNVSFKPGGVSPFLQCPLSELHNQIVSLDLLWGNFAAEIRERLYHAATVEARFALLEQLLLARLNEMPDGLNAVCYAVTEIARNHGVLSIRALSDEIGISQKHLITQFKQLVGGTPKELARIYRFNHILHRIDPTQPIDWSQVAYQSSYYDQSHFNKDFETFTGHNPTNFLQLRRQIMLENPKHSQYPQHLPTG
ncbi:MAG: helix-turn-helix domain-containing protein [Chloroflexi bacterium]|nr:helix-turn-helix domain-containing protein [Chloroflexota bacterium]